MHAEFEIEKHKFALDMVLFGQVTNSLKEIIVSRRGFNSGFCLKVDLHNRNKLAG